MHTATFPLIRSTKQSKKGFGLLEVILVFAIVIGAAAVVFTVFQSAKPSADAASEGSNISTIATNLKSTFGISHDYSGVSDITAVEAKAIPASMVSGTTAAPVVSSQWGAVTLSGVAAAAGVPSEYTISYATVPDDTCAKLVSGLAGFFTDVQVNGATVFSAPGVVSEALLMPACSTNGAAGETVAFIGQ